MLVERFWERVRLFAARRLGNRTSADDVAQETLLGVLTALREGRVHTPEALPAFVFQTARNICRQRHRSMGREARAFDRFRQWLTVTATVPDPLRELITDEERGSVRRALARLDPRDRDLLRWSYYEGVDTGEVARRLQATPGAVRVRRHRALKRLRALLEGAGPETPAAERQPLRAESHGDD